MTAISIVFFVGSGISVLAGIQERKDSMRCIGCMALAFLAFLAGMAVLYAPPELIDSIRG